MTSSTDGPPHGSDPGPGGPPLSHGGAVLAELSRIDNGDVLELRLPPGGRAGAPPGGGTLELRLDGDPDRTVPVAAEALDGGRLRADLAGLSLDDGMWDVLWIGADGAATPLLTTDPGVNLADRYAYLSRPRHRELRAVRDPRGPLRVRARTVGPYAEATWVEVAPDAVTVSGVLAYTPPVGSGTGVAVVARQRELDGVVTGPAGLDGDRFTATVPLPPVVDGFEPERPHNEWDLWLSLPGTGDLRFSAHADDITAKKKKFVYPHVVRSGVRVRPYYTVDDDLSLLATAEEAR
jgi:hypothetical protein